MTTRPRGTSGRSSKRKPPPQAAGDEPKREDSNQSAAPAERVAASEEERPQAEVTSARLERREIPSFAETREQRIAEAAYWRAERRGFAPGRELDDWLEAEREIDARSNENDPSRNQNPDGRTA
jgi:hypothetical protein